MSRREAALNAAVQLKKTQAAVTAPPAAQTDTDAATPFPRLSEGPRVKIDPAAVDPHIVCITDPGAAAAEQYRKLRAWILRAAAANPFFNTVLITSPDAGEGKTVTALNLAVVMAQHLDTTVLLVDADLRNPSLHSALGIKAARGLSDYLSGAAGLDEVLLRTDLGTLTLLPGGTPPENPSELLYSERMRLLLHELKHRYRDRHVIFDTSPVLSTAEPLALGAHTDGVILLVSASRTSPKAAARAVKLMKGLPFLGVVYNNVPASLGKEIYTYRSPYGKRNVPDLLGVGGNA